MKNLSVILGRTLIAMTLVAAMPAPVRAQNAQPSTAQTFLADGKEAAEAEQWDKAAKLFAQSFQLEPLPKTAGHLGRALIKSGELVAGANQLEYFLHEEQQPSKMADAARELLATIKPKVATVAFKLDPQQAPVEAYLDGQRIEDKRLTWPLHVAPGEHAFEFKKEGFVTQTVRGNYVAGEPLVITPKLEPVVPQNGNGGPKKVGPTGGLAPEAKIGFVVAGGLAAVAVGTGIGTMVTYGPTRDAFVAKDVSEYENHRYTLQGLTWTATISGALAVGAFAYAITRPRTGSTSNEAPKVGFVVVPTVGGMAITGTW